MNEWLWIVLTLFAVSMQTVRTAGQKHLTRHMDAVAATLVRFLYGLPFAIAYLVAVTRWHQVPVPAFNTTFVVFAVVASVAQIVATALLIYLFSLRNFAVGTTYARTEAFLTALLGALFFGELITLPGWAAILLSVAGVVVLTIARTQPYTAAAIGQKRSFRSSAPHPSPSLSLPHVPRGRERRRQGIRSLFAGSDLPALPVLKRLWNPAAAVGLGSGLGFALASLSLRKASLSLGVDNFQLAAGTTLVTMVTIQTVLTCLWVGLRSARQFSAIFRQWRVCTFVGLTSALGSIGWFTAMTLERASYVKALGQVEFVFALAVSTFFFGERSNRLELSGMGMIGAGVLVLVVAG